MACGCQKRREAWLKKRREKLDQGKKAQAAAIGAAVATIDAFATTIGIKPK